ncbi:putative mediator of RNA polymerase II transcription subunit 29 [Maniola jurtina]|uniref:putative mediator of RNA polymerase II transcription subunit 29 n=1 Tax=Maniola jurtina TaxID=191418 RepID=UPI001E688505|nr:putative mediator of RNA polymerase II transcription subunit 29 [Maniola jurtina]
MKTVVTFQVFILVFISTFYQEGVSGQSFYPPYGGAPIVYDNSDDGDIGLLLTVLLLATRNRNGNCNNCCNCSNCGNSARTMPVPYPVPFPTNCAIVNNKSQPPYYGYRNCCCNDDNDNNDNDDDNSNTNTNTAKVINRPDNSNSLIST